MSIACAVISKFGIYVGQQRLLISLQSTSRNMLLRVLCSTLMGSVTAACGDNQNKAIQHQSLEFDRGAYSDTCCRGVVGRVAGRVVGVA